MKTTDHPENQISVYYHPESEIGKKILALVQKEPNTASFLELTTTPLTPTQIIDVSKKLGTDPTELIDSTATEQNLEDLNYTDVATVLKKNPEYLKYPIAIRGEQVELIKTSTDILKLTEIVKNKYDNTISYQ